MFRLQSQVDGVADQQRNEGVDRVRRTFFSLGLDRSSLVELPVDVLSQIRDVVVRKGQRKVLYRSR